jgi:filamentous hemagglutinin family protein
MSGLLLFGQTVPLMGNPTGGAVVAGAATIGPAGATLTINQSTQSAIINWQSFSIANGETTKFIVPNSGSETLNRVVGGNPSAIYGSLQSNGIVYLVNPNGIVVGPSGQINTASFLASTLDVSNEQFLAGGDLSFSGSSSASINNSGVIHASGGDVYLIANQVNNSGTISAPKGTVGLAAGSDILFQPAGDQHLFVQATPAGTTRATGVTNSGTIRAAAAELKAAGGNAYALAINNTGVIAATGYKKINGQVYLTSDGGSLSNSGMIRAKQANGNGGKIVMDGTAKTAATSGTVTNSGTLNASATVAKGAGGSITVKNMGGTTINTASGVILASGGTGGAGGSIETSGKSLGIDGTVSAGQGGTWLLDPTDVTIDNGSGVAPDVNVTTLTTALNGGTSENVQANGSTDSGNIDLNANLTWTSTATLTLTATGNINLNNALNGTAGTLNLDAGGTISDTAALNVSAFILTNGSWTQNSATLPTFSATNDFELQGGTFLRVGGGDGTDTPYLITDVYGLQGIASPSGNLLADNFMMTQTIDASPSFNWNSGQGFMPIGNGSSVFSGSLNGQGFSINDLGINQAFANYIGLFGETATGATISNLSLGGGEVTGGSDVGALVGVNNGATISNVSSNTTVMGDETTNGNDTGGIVGDNMSGTLSNLNNSGHVTGGANVGGITGYNNGSITGAVNTGQVTGEQSTVGGVVGFADNSSSVNNSWNTGTVTGVGVNVGGLVGYNASGTVETSYNAGAVTGDGGAVGGLLGENAGTVLNCYSIGSVMGAGSNSTGGLVGNNFGYMNNTYSTGSVSGSSTEGGLTAINTGTIGNSFWDTTTSGQSTSNGGTGEATPALLSESTYSGAGWNIGTTTTDTWVIFDGSTRPLLGMEYSVVIRNAHQLQLVGLNATTEAATYFQADNIDASGTSNQADIWGSSTAIGAGFVPIQNFSGDFQGTVFYTINHLYINQLSTNAGLFSNVTNTGVVDGVVLNQVDITGSSGNSAGALVGTNSGLVENSSSTGTVNGTASDSAGGLVGINFGSIENSSSGANVTGDDSVGGLVGNNSGTIANSYSTGTVMGGTDFDAVGGLVGYNENGSITASYSSSPVTGSTSGFYLGGLVGYSSATISDSYATGAVTAGGSGVFNVGGFAGLNGSTIQNSYSTGLVTGNQASNVGGFVGTTGGAFIYNSFWDTDSSGQTNGVGNGGSVSGLTGAVTLDLESQSFIEANEPHSPQWAFGSVWTTNGDTTTPQLIGLPATTPPTGGTGMGGSTDDLSGTAFSDAFGNTPEAGTGLIEAIFDGSVVGSTTVGSGGTFSFTLSATDLTGGLLLTDLNTNGGNTYFQSNTAGGASGINIYGNTLTVIADTASNAALKSVIAGLPGGNNVLYSVSSANVLSTSAGAGMNIVSGYTLDGNITVSGALSTASTANLASTQAVTLTGGTVALSGNLSSTSAVNVVSTAGDIDINNLGSTDVPATAASMTLTSAGAVSMSGSDIVLNGGNFTATGTGSATDSNGIDLTNSTIDTEGGNISLTGQAGYFYDSNVGYEAGTGVSLYTSTLETTAGGEDAPTGGNVTIMGNGSIDPSVMLATALTGVSIVDSSVTVENGALGITGTISTGTSSAYNNGVYIINDVNQSSIQTALVSSTNFSQGDNEVIAANGSGSVTITGNTAGSTAVDYNDGVNITNATIQVVNGTAGINITGTGGNFAEATNSPNSVGVSVYLGTTIDATGSAPITIHGTGGIDTLGNTSGYSGGILVSGDTDQPTAISSTSGAIALTGVGGVSTGFSFGVDITGDGEDATAAVVSSTSGAITLTGLLTAAANPCLFPQAIVIQNEGAVQTDTGAISLVGTVTGSVADNATATQATGVIVRGGGTVEALDDAGTVSITGTTTGALTMDVNYGVQLDDAQISTAGGALTIMGTAATAEGSIDTEGLLIADGTTVSATDAPITLTGTVSGGASASGGFVAGMQILNGTVQANGTGSIVITADAAGSTGSSEDVGLYASGATIGAEDASGTAVSGITITGTAGTVGNVVQNAGAVGLYLYQGTNITATGTAPITLMGTGGTDTNTTASLNTFSAGIFDSDQTNDESNLISTTSGTISVTGTGGVSPSLSMGINLYGPDGGIVNIVSTTGNITLNGSLTTAANPSLSLFGAFLEIGSTVATTNGVISITGTVPGGSASVGTTAQADGLLLENNQIMAIGTGSISLTGNATGVTGNNQIGGLLVIAGDVSTGAGNITLNGSETTSSTVRDELFGVVLRSASTITTDNGSISVTGTANSGTAGKRDFGVRLSEGSTISALGENGNVTVLGSTVGSTGDAFTTGVVVEGAGSAINADGTLMVTGNAGALAGTATGSILDPSGDNVSYDAASVGIMVSEGSSLTTNGSGAMTLIGTGGANTNTSATSGSYGVAIFSPVAETTTGVSASDALSLTGTAGSSASAGIGVLIGGPQNLGSVNITTGSATITGTGGAGNVAESALPNAGVYDSTGSGSTNVEAQVGDLNLIGTTGSGTPALAVYLGGMDESLPSLVAEGTVSIASNSGVVSYDASVDSESLAFSTPAGSQSTLTDLGATPIDLAGGDFTLDLTSPLTLGTVSVSSLTINASAEDVDLGTTSASDLVINGAGSVTQSGPITISTLTIANAGSVTLTDAGNNITSLGAISSFGTIDIFTDPGLTLTSTITSPAAITIAETGGDLTFDSGGQVIETGTANIILAAGTDLANSHYIVNDSASGANAIQPGSGVYYLYASDPTYNTLGGLTITPANMVYGATYPGSSNSFAGTGSAVFYFVAALGDVGPNPPDTNPTLPSTTTGGAAGGGSNLVPPALTPQPSQTGDQTSYTTTSGGDDDSGGGSQPPPFSFVGTGVSQLLGQLDGGLANSASNSGLVGTGDIALLDGGQLNNASNPEAAGTLEEALGPIVYQNLADALKALGDWADVPDSSHTADNGEGETILTGGDVAEMSSTAVKNIPLSQAPEQLRNAMNSPTLQNAGAGH